MAEIDRLELAITAGSDDAVDKIGRLTSSLGRFRGVSKQATESARDFGSSTSEASERTGRLAGETDRAGSSASSFGDKVKKATAPLKSFASMVGNGIAGAAKTGLSGITSFIGGIARIAKFRIYRTIVKDLGQSFKDLYGYSDAFGIQYAASVDKITTAFTYLRNSIAAMVAPLVNMLAPVLDTIIDKVVEALNWFNQLFAAIGGQRTYTVAKKIAVNYGDTLQSTASKAKKAADEIKRTILGFDEINKLVKETSKTPSSSTGSSPYSDNYKLMFEQRNVTGGFRDFGKALESAMENSVSRLWLILSGASLVLGAILTFSGANPALGIGLMVGGAVGLAKTLSPYWDTLHDLMEGPIGTLTTMLSGAMLVLGFVALAAGRIPLGVGLVVGGALGIASNIPARWDRLQGYMEGPLGVLTEIISAAALVLGFVAIAAGRIPLGVGLLVSGAFGLVAALPARWDRLQEYIKGPVGTITAIISGAALMLGFVALAAGRIPLGVGLLVSGAFGLATTLPARWDRLMGYIESPIEAVTALISAASLLLGFLAIAAGRIPLGLGLIVTGAYGLGKTLADKWDTFKTQLDGRIGAAVAVISGATLLLGIIAIMGGNIPLGIGLLVSGASGLGGSIAANWENLKGFGAKAIQKVKDGWDTLKDKAFEIKAKIATAASDLWNDLKQAWDDLMASGKEFLEIKIKPVLENNPVSKGLQSASSNAGKVVKGMADGAEKMLDWLFGTNYSSYSAPIEKKVTVKVDAKPGKYMGYGDDLANALSVEIEKDSKVNVLVDLLRNGWSTVVDWTTRSQGGNVEQGVGLVKQGWTQIDRWAELYKGGKLDQPIALAKTGWSLISSWVKNYKGSDVAQPVKLSKDGWSWVNAWVKQYATTPVTQAINLSVNNWSGFLNGISRTLHSWWPWMFAEGGSINARGVVRKFANGGIINAYAGGTSNAHGTMFLAGEAGPEIVGHIGGRTEVLNKSQLAATMYAAVRQAMSGVTLDANFYDAPSSMADDENMGMLLELVRVGSEATQRQNDLLRQQNEYLREINSKDFNPEITTSAIQRAMDRSNRRAGITVMPVGAT